MIRKLVDQRGVSLLRLAADLQSYLRARKFLAIQTATYQFACLSFQDVEGIRGSKNSDTLFILGSGSSVNSLTDQQWEEISANVSVGVNHWTIHRFIPDIYSVETVPAWRVSEEARAKIHTNDHLSHLKHLERDEVLVSRPLIISLAPRSYFEKAQLEFLPLELAPMLRLYFRFTPVTRNLRNLPNDLRYDLRVSALSQARVVLPDSGASIVRLIALAALTGFRKVVLLGVDLSTRYFWEDGASNLYDPKLKAFDQPMRGETHETNTRNNRPFTVVEMVMAYQRLLKHKIVISHSSDSRELAEFLPRYRWAA